MFCRLGSFELNSGRLHKMPQQVIILLSFLLLIICLIRFSFIYRKKESDVYVVLMLLGLLYASSVLYLNHIGQLARFVHLYRTSAIAIYISLSSTFLFIRKSIFKQKFTDTDLLFFLPAAFYLTDMMPMLLQSGEVKKRILLGEITDNSMEVYHHGWLINHNNHFFLLNIWAVFLAIWQIAMLGYRLKAGGQDFYRRNKSVVVWFFVWSVGSLIASLPDAWQAITGTKPDVFSEWYTSSVLLINFVVPVSLLLSPSILRGIRGNWIYVPPVETSEVTPNVESPSLPQTLLEEPELENEKEGFESDDIASIGKVYFKVEDADKIKADLDNHMRKTKAYLNPGFNINDLSRETGHSPRLVSSLLNNHALTSFKDYINRYRILHLIEEYKKNTSSKKTLEQWGMECGFQNRYTFINAFKRVTGSTPSKYFAKDVAP